MAPRRTAWRPAGLQTRLYHLLYLMCYDVRSQFRTPRTSRPARAAPSAAPDCTSSRTARSPLALHLATQQQRRLSTMTCSLSRDTQCEMKCVTHLFSAPPAVFLSTEALFPSIPPSLPSPRISWADAPFPFHSCWVCAAVGVRVSASVCAPVCVCVCVCVCVRKRARMHISSA